MTNQPREFWIDESDIHDGDCPIAFYEHPRQGPLLWQSNLVHVIEAGPVLEKIRRLEAALQKCKEQRNWFIKCLLITRIELEELKEANDKELESILEGI